MSAPAHPLDEVPAPRFNPWEWLSAACMAGMEACWLAPWLRGLSPQAAPASNLAVVSYFAGLIGLAYLAAKLLGEFRLVRAVQRGVLAGVYGLGVAVGALGLLTPAAALPPDPPVIVAGLGEVTRLLPGEVVVGAFGLWAVWRGVVMAQQGTGSFAVMRFFKVGVGMLLGFIALTASLRHNLTGLLFFVGFVFVALVGLAAGKVSVLGKLRGGRRNPFDRRWVAGIAAASLGVVGAAAALGALLSGQFMEYYRRVISLLITLGIGVVVAPILLVVSFLPIDQLAQEPTPTPGPFISAWELENAGPTAPIDAFDRQAQALPPSWRAYLYWGALVLGAALALFLLWRVGLELTRRATDASEVLFQPGDLLETLRNWRTRNLTLPGLDRLRQRQRLQAAARIRQVYAALLDLCADLGSPRPPALTPLEFLPTLAALFPHNPQDLRQLTQAYLKVRYGEFPETQAEIDALEKVWLAVQEAGKARKKIAPANDQ